jgi:hypothetical protein
MIGFEQHEAFGGGIPEKKILLLFGKALGKGCQQL